MSRVLAPAFTGTLNDKPLRFFKAPMPESHLPWHAAEDLHACLDLPRDLRRYFQQQLRSSEWKADVQTVATASGIVTIAPHFIAQGLIGAMIDVGQSPASTEIRYSMQVKQAWDAIYPGGNFAEAISLLVTAYHNTSGPSGGAA
jgi:hypothetical protein